MNGMPCHSGWRMLLAFSFEIKDLDKLTPEISMFSTI